MDQFAKSHVKSIRKVGVQKTRDILILADDKYQNEGNFIVDGVIVHNSIPETIANRDSNNGEWQAKLIALSNDLYKTLESTYGNIVYQEQLQQIWQLLGGFTATQSQEARKAVAKKWVDKLKPIENKWLEGASKTIGREAAEEWWSKMVSFGRYAFNKSHSVAYTLVAYRCLFLKTYYPAEWWATVMSRCHRDKLTRFMEVAKSENVEFGIFDPNHLTGSFTVLQNKKGNDYISPGLLGVKNIRKTAAQFEGKGNFKNIDEFIEAKGKHKTTMERLIKLGTFSRMEKHSNIKLTYLYYLYKFGSGKDVTALKKEFKAKLLEKQGWTEATINAEISRQAKEYRNEYPKRTKIPQKILNWKPKPHDDLFSILDLDIPDYTIKELLAFEKEYLGYYLRSPLDIYACGGYSITKAKKRFASGEESSWIEGVVREASINQTKVKETDRGTTGGNNYLKLSVFDAKLSLTVFCWQKEFDESVEQWYMNKNKVKLTEVIKDLRRNRKPMDEIEQYLVSVYDDFVKALNNSGILLNVVYNDEKSFYNVARSSCITLLKLKD